MKSGLISKELGGTANWAEKVENYPGYSGSCEKLMKKFAKQAIKFGVEILNDDIINLEKDDNGFIVVVSSKKIIHTKTIIIALGTQKRKLNIKGEDDFLGKGVSYCATCDAFFFKNKEVAVIGGGNSACKSALLLAGITNKVYLVHRGEKEKCDDSLLKKVKEKKKIIDYNKTSPMEIRGKQKVEELIIWKDDKEMKLKVDGVFIEIGGLPLSDIAKMIGLKLDEQGYIHVDSEMKTDIEGVFAAGDIIKSKLKQIVVAASQGAIAAKSAFDFVSGR